MAFIGNTPTTQAFTPAVDYFSGNGSTTAFTLSRPVASVAQVQVTIDNVAQNPSSAYTVSGSTITFTSAPLSGTNNIYIYYTSPITQVIAPGQGTVTATSMASSTGTGAGVFQTSPTITTPTIDTITSAASTALTLKSAGTTAVTIDTSQNVGIGTTSPTSGKLVISGTSVTTSQGIRLVGDTADARFICESATLGAGILGTFSNHAQLFYTNATERMRIDTSGNLLVGTTSNIAANAKIFAQGNGVGIAVGYGTGSTAYRHMYMNSGDGTLYFFNPTNYAYLSAAGAWTNASDARLKKNIVDIKYGLADVLKAQPRSYQMNAVDGDFVGFIAQELKEIIPEVVTGDPEKQLGVDYGSLVAVAFKAIQELKAINDQQAETINALTARIEALENK